MNPSPQAIAAIRQKVTDWTPDDATIAEGLNAETIDDPSPQGQVPNPVYESILLSLLTDPNNGSIVKLINWPNFGLLKADIESQNRPGIMLWCQALAAAGIITASEAASISSYIQGSRPDPDWPAKLSWSTVTLGRPIDIQDIHFARPE